MEYYRKCRRTPGRFLACIALAFGAALTGAGVVSAVAQPASETIGSIWQQHSSDPDLAWRDPTSHTRVVNLTSGFESASVFYFHQNIFTADGDLMLFSGKRGEDQGYFVLSLRTGAIRQVTHQAGQHLVVLPHRRSAAFDRGDDVFLLNLDSGETRKIATVPHGLLAQGAGFGFTADEGKLLFAYCDQLAEEHAQLVAAKPKMDDPHLRRVDWVAAYEHMQRHNAIYSIDIDSGKVAVVFQGQRQQLAGTRAGLAHESEPGAVHPRRLCHGAHRKSSAPARIDDGAGDHAAVRGPGRHRLRLSAQGIPAQRPGHHACHGRGPGKEVHGRSCPGHRVERRASPAPERRPLHVRRGKRPAERPRRPTRHPPQQASLPASQRPLGTADGRQQRGNPEQRAPHPARRSRVVQNAQLLRGRRARRSSAPAAR